MTSSRAGQGSIKSGGRGRRSVVQAMRAANRGRGAVRSPAFEIAGLPTSSSAASLPRLFKQARANGSLNLTSKGLTEVPGQVFGLADDVDIEGGEKFWEVCELQRLDLSFNSISYLPPQIRKNNLTRIPPEVFLLESLSTLDLTGNAIEELPEEQVGSAAALKALLLSGNHLSRLPMSVGDLMVLETLELGDNNISSLPDSVGRLSRLSVLTVGGNALTCLPDSHGELAALSLLDISRNAVERLPKGLKRLVSLTALDVRENKITDFPPLPQSDRLAQVFLGFNLLSTLDGGALLRVSGGLTELHLQSNHIVNLPDEIGSLARLKTLDVANNDLADLPAGLGYLPELHRLAVDGNPLRTIRRTLLSGAASALKKYLRTRGPCPSYPGLDPGDGEDTPNESLGVLSDAAVQDVLRSALETCSLDVEGRGLTSLTPGLFEDSRVLSGVTRAKLTGNKFQTLPEEISNFQKLMILEADNNELTSLPAAISYLSLQRLSLRRNALSSAEAVDAFLTPPSSPAGSLPLSRSIRELDLSSNGLSDVPYSIFACRGLQTLGLGFNNLSDLSGLTWASLSSLENLDLSNNRLRRLGDVVLMTWLRRLNLENNEISSLPLDLGLCTGLESLLLAGNPQRQASTTLQQRGTGALLSFLRGRLPFDHRPRSPLTPPPPPPPAGSTYDRSGPFPAAGRGQGAEAAAAAAVGGANDSSGAEGTREARRRIAALQKEVAALSEEADAPGMSQAKAYAVKKKLQMKRAVVMREERALKQAQLGAR